jgi:hypothetical protein
VQTIRRFFGEESFSLAKAVRLIAKALAFRGFHTLSFPAGAAGSRLGPREIDWVYWMGCCSTLFVEVPAFSGFAAVSAHGLQRNVCTEAR